MPTLTIFMSIGVRRPREKLPLPKLEASRQLPLLAGQPAEVGFGIAGLGIFLPEGREVHGQRGGRPPRRVVVAHLVERAVLAPHGQRGAEAELPPQTQLGLAVDLDIAEVGLAADEALGDDRALLGRGQLTDVTEVVPEVGIHLGAPRHADLGHLCIFGIAGFPVGVRHDAVSL